MRIKPTPVVLALLLVTGCGTYSLIEPKQTKIGSNYTVEPQIQWNSRKAGKSEVWTVDGPSLQAIRFVRGLKDGEPLFETGSEKQPKFRGGMVPSEITELVVDSITSAGGQNVEASNLKPQKFGEASGFRFDVSFLSRSGLEMQALVVGAVIQDRLHLLLYSGARLHYYGKHKTEVEQMIESIRMQ